jgi:hypothetical protein
MAIQDIVVKDFWWKFLAFVLATLIWANFGGKLDERIEVDESGVHVANEPEQVVETVLSRPIERPIAVLRGGEVAGTYRVEPVQVRVVVSASRERFRTLDPKLILAFVDVTDMNEKANGTTHTRPVSRMVQVYVPPGVELMSVEPRSVVVERISSPTPVTTDSTNN